MNVERLKLLADTIEKGVVEFPDLGHVVAFNMAMIFISTDKIRVFDRSDILEPEKVTACGCNMGFTILLFSDDKLKRAVAEFSLVSDEQFDFYTEAKLLLDLDAEQAVSLFYGRMSPTITGERVANVIRRLILTEQVDWSAIAY